MTLKRLRSLAKDGATGLAVALAAMVALELGLRAFFPQVLRGTSIRGERFSIDDPELGIRYVPDAIWRFRHPEYTVEHAINGQGLGRVDLVKAGRQGMDTRSELLLLRQLAPVYEPDAVVVGFLINDLYTNVPLEGAAQALKATNTKIYQVKGSALNLHLATLARRLAISTDRGYVRLYLLNPRRGDFLERPLPEKAQQKIATTQALLRELAATCDSLGVPLYVLSIPQQFQVLYQPEPGSRVEVDLYDREFGRLAQSEGFAWVPTLEAFRSAAGGKPLFHRVDGHLTPAGNAVLAGVFVREVIPRVLAQIERHRTRP